jgi:hypothetical protein
VLLKKPGFEVISGSLDIEQTVKPATPRWWILSHWPRAWLVFVGVVTLAWAIALGWVAFVFVGWIFD